MLFIFINNNNMQHNQTTSQTVIINTDIYTKYNTTVIVPANVTTTPSLPNDLNKSVVYPTMFDRWRDI